MDAEHGLQHTDDTSVNIGTIDGNIEDLTLISADKVDITSGGSLEDVAFYVQNNNANDVSVISANNNITLFDTSSSELLSLVTRTARSRPLATSR